MFHQSYEFNPLQRSIFLWGNSLGGKCQGLIVWGAITMETNFRRDSCPEGNYPGGQLSGGQLSKGQLSGGQFPREKLSRGQFFCSILRHLPPPQIIISRTIAPWIITPRIIAPQTNAKATTEMCSTKQLSTLVTIYPMYYLTWSSSFSKITGWRRN